MINRSSLPILLPLLFIGMRLASSVTADISYFLLAIYALQGRVQVIQALFLSWLFGMLSMALSPYPSLDTVGRYFVILGAVLSVVRFGFFTVLNLRAKKSLQLTLLLGIFLLLHSVFVSQAVDVSSLKVVSWLLVMITLISAWGGIEGNVKAQLIGQLFSVLLAIMLFSLPLVMSPLGYYVNDTGFQGLLNQPQAFGAAMGVLAVWEGMKMLSFKIPPIKHIFFFIASFVLMIMSEARTAGFALLLGVGIAMFLNLGLTGQPIVKRLPGVKSSRFVLMMVISVLVMITQADRLGEYFQKRTDTSNLVDVYKSSRGDAMDAMWENIQLEPFLGIGFGIASDLRSMVIVRDPIFDLPLSAPVEKGVLPLAVLEELGVFGFIIVGLWFFLVIKRSSLGGFDTLAVCLTILLQNMGEAMFFSAGGMGLLSIILIAWVMTSESNSKASDD